MSYLKLLILTIIVTNIATYAHAHDTPFPTKAEQLLGAFATIGVAGVITASSNYLCKEPTTDVKQGFYSIYFFYRSGDWGSVSYNRFVPSGYFGPAGSTVDTTLIDGVRYTIESDGISLDAVGTSTNREPIEQDIDDTRAFPLRIDEALLWPGASVQYREARIAFYGRVDKREERFFHCVQLKPRT